MGDSAGVQFVPPPAAPSDVPGSLLEQAAVIRPTTEIRTNDLREDRDRKVAPFEDRCWDRWLVDLRWSGRSKGWNGAGHGLRGYGQPNASMDSNPLRALSTNQPFPSAGRVP